jgi:hypothetical protein
VDLLGGVRGVSPDLEAAPVDADGDDGAQLCGGEGSDDDVGGGGGISRLDLNEEGGLRADLDSRSKTKRRLLFRVLEEQTFQHLHLNYSEPQ